MQACAAASALACQRTMHLQAAHAGGCEPDATTPPWAAISAAKADMEVSAKFCDCGSPEDAGGPTCAFGSRKKVHP